ncbi:toxin HicA [uncultured Desulfosarcina sp.]|uniref:toxin HicA n=1 Tax=uncultured Desulfosarcina sp. TaxID=218289 RepID=UPI0029C6B8B1|nr:toxin HicA [uncultured Desulfosarcina sp.]
MGQIEKLLNEIYKNPTNVKFTDLCRVCEHYFGKARQSGSSHRVYKTPWQGDPRVNIQNNKGKAKAYQVKQVIKAIERLEVESDTTK